MSAGPARRQFPTGPDNSGAITADLIQSSPGNPLVLNGQTALTAQVAGVTVLNLLAGSVTSAQPMVVPSIGENLTDQHSIPTGTADLVAADSAKLGQQVVLATMDYTQTWFQNDYCGPWGVTVASRNTATLTLPMSFPIAGVLSNFRVQSIPGAPAPTALNIAIYKSSGGNSPSYSVTTAIIPVANGDCFGNYSATTVTIAANDLVLCRIDQDWVASAVVVSAKFTPT